MLINYNIYIVIYHVHFLSQRIDMLLIFYLFYFADEQANYGKATASAHKSLPERAEITNSGSNEERRKFLKLYTT